MPQRTAFPLALAALTVDLTATPAAPTEFRLLPLGRFRAADGSGRPHGIPDGWSLDAAGAARLVAQAAARASRRVIDYEHQTLNAAKNGQPAPAAGWIGRLEARADGLWAADVEWTAPAAAMIAAREYRYISPVFPYDPRTGEVRAIVHAALTNDPGLDGLTDLAALTARAAALFSPPEELPMKELLKALGLAETASEPEALAALTALKTAHQGELAVLKANQANQTQAPDPAKYVEVATLTAVQGERAALATELASLKAEQAKAAVDKLVEGALAAGKLTPATEPHARKLAGDIAALSAFIDALPAVVTPGDTQTGGKAPASGEGGKQLDAAQLAVCRAMGVKPEDFIKTLTAEGENHA